MARVQVIRACYSAVFLISLAQSSCKSINKYAIPAIPNPPVGTSFKYITRLEKAAFLTIDDGGTPKITKQGRAEEYLDSVITVTHVEQGRLVAAHWKINLCEVRKDVEPTERLGPLEIRQQRTNGPEFMYERIDGLALNPRELSLIKSIIEPPSTDGNAHLLMLSIPPAEVEIGTKWHARHEAMEAFALNSDKDSILDANQSGIGFTLVSVNEGNGSQIATISCSGSLLFHRIGGLNLNSPIPLKISATIVRDITPGRINVSVVASLEMHGESTTDVGHAKATLEMKLGERRKIEWRQID